MSSPTPKAKHGSQSALWRRKEVRRLLLIALLAETAYAVLNISTMPVYLKFDRGFGEGVIALVVAGFLFSEAIFKTPMGSLSDKFGRRRFLVLGPGLTVFTSLATLIIPKDWGYTESILIIGLRLLDGLGAAMLWPAAFALMSDTVSDKERSESMSLLNMCYLVGVALALPIGGIINDLFGRFLRGQSGNHSPSLFLTAVLFAGVSFAAYRFLPSGKEHREKLSAANPDTVHPSGLKLLLESARSIPQFLLIGGLTFMGIGFPLVIAKIFAKEQLGMSETSFGMLALPGTLVMAALSVPMARLGERLGRSRSVHVGLLFCFAGLGMISLGAFWPLFRSLWVLMLAGIPVGLGFLLTIPAWYASVCELDEQRRAANIGAVMTAQGLGTIVGALIGGKFYESLQVYGADFGRYSPFLGCAACVFLSWILSLRVIRDRAVPMAQPES